MNPLTSYFSAYNSVKTAIIEAEIALNKKNDAKALKYAIQGLRAQFVALNCIVAMWKDAKRKPSGKRRRK